jgi:hypothetical protein
VYRSPLVYLAPSAALALIACAVASFLFMFVSFGLSPCSESSFATQAASWAVPTSFVVAAAIVVRLMFNGGWRSFALAALLPCIAVASYAATVPFEAARQTACAAQSYQEAMASCRADPADYRLGEDSYGYPTLTLHAPGTTDRSWSCLSDWALHNSRVFDGHFSIDIDKSVYVTTRQQAHTADTNQNANGSLRSNSGQ